MAGSLIVGSGIASAAPNVDAIVNSTCTYPQVIAALNAQDPATADQVASSPVATGWLQQLVAASPDQRRNMIAQVQGVPQIQAFGPVINQVASTCNNF
ncbi:hemophore-related protein [soil metagenome]